MSLCIRILAVEIPGSAEVTAVATLRELDGLNGGAIKWMYVEAVFFKHDSVGG